MLSPVREQGLIAETVDMKMNFKKGLMSPLTSGNSLSLKTSHASLGGFPHISRSSSIRRQKARFLCLSESRDLISLKHVACQNPTCQATHSSSHVWLYGSSVLDVSAWVETGKHL